MIAEIADVLQQHRQTAYLLLRRYLEREQKFMLRSQVVDVFDEFCDMKLALDIGHGQILARRNRALDHIVSFYEKIAIVNVHDNNGSMMLDDVLKMRKERNVSQGEIRELAVRYDTHLPIGEGEIDFDTIFKELKQRGYNGRFCMMCDDPTDFTKERQKFTELWLAA